MKIPGVEYIKEYIWPTPLPEVTAKIEDYQNQIKEAKDLIGEVNDLGPQMERISKQQEKIVKLGEELEKLNFPSENDFIKGPSGRIILILFQGMTFVSFCGTIIFTVLGSLDYKGNELIGVMGAMVCGELLTMEEVLRYIRRKFAAQSQKVSSELTDPEKAAIKMIVSAVQTWQTGLKEVEKIEKKYEAKSRDNSPLHSQTLIMEDGTKEDIESLHMSNNEHRYDERKKNKINEVLDIHIAHSMSILKEVDDTVLKNFPGKDMVLCKLIENLPDYNPLHQGLASVFGQAEPPESPSAKNAIKKNLYDSQQAKSIALATPTPTPKIKFYSAQTITEARKRAEDTRGSVIIDIKPVESDEENQEDTASRIQEPETIPMDDIEKKTENLKMFLNRIPFEMKHVFYQDKGAEVPHRA